MVTLIMSQCVVGSNCGSFEKMGCLDGESGNSLGYIHYYPLDNFLLTNSSSVSLTNIDISGWKVVDYQRMG